MRISDIKVTTVTVPLEAPLRHAAGAHWGRFVRTIVQVYTDEAWLAWGRWAAVVKARKRRSWR
jgi:glucarate dehydratase